MTPCLLLKIFPPLVVVILLGACSSTPAPPPPLTFDVTTTIQTNDGGLFYFVVRSANEKQFMLETYQDVAKKAFSAPPEQGVLGVFSVVPGSQQEYTVNQPAEGTIALYFLLTKPGSQWKKLLSTPLEDQYNINIKANSQVEVNKDTHWYSWF